MTILSTLVSSNVTLLKVLQYLLKDDIVNMLSNVSIALGILLAITAS